ncbi:MAG: Rrf2 family transcriptional regulator [Chitinophagaceae bacterium]|nr:Rrf2 family transcriptional regulator [Chitinophagaceae bacterium]MCW5905163.1 Rrf2 family transcriptional regulator [Chitinophagaceae bacterium]
MFSKSTEYALRATIYIARQSSIHKKVSIQEIAEGIDAPKHFTAKILQLLSNKSTKIVSSITGPSGGFFITEEERKKPIYSVIEIMNETYVIEDCVLGLPNCNEKTPCSLYKPYEKIKKELLKMFRDKTIDDIANSKDRIIPVNLDFKKKS